MTLRDKLLAFDADLPLERAQTIPRGWYRDADVYEAERRTIFGRTWLAAGRADLVREPGSFLTATVAEEPILVVRDLDGTLRAFAIEVQVPAGPWLERGRSPAPSSGRPVRQHALRLCSRAPDLFEFPAALFLGGIHL